MENWGLATYTEPDFLIGQESTIKNEISAVRVIAHEISHMWFGNWVTCKW